MKNFKCHFCGEQAAFAVDSQFFCFSCGMGGDRISCLRARDKITYKDAARRLRLPLLPEENRKEKKKKVLAALAEAENFFFEKKSPKKTSYLKKRKISKEITKTFRLGYAKGGTELYDFLLEKGIEKEIMEEAGLVYTKPETNKTSDKFWDRVMFPIRDENGKTIGFGGRVLGDKKPKYLNSPESIVFDKSHNLYALDIAKESSEDYFLLAEGYIDVISLHQNGFKNAVASLGTAFTYGQAELISKYKKLVYIIPDSDAPGQKAAEKAIFILLKKGIEVKVVSTAPYKDVDEFLVAEGPEAFKEQLRKAVDGRKFLLRDKTAEEIAAFLFKNT